MATEAQADTETTTQEVDPKEALAVAIATLRLLNDLTVRFPQTYLLIDMLEADLSYAIDPTQIVAQPTGRRRQ